METEKNTTVNYIDGGEELYTGSPIHSQVMKIKQEFEKIRHPSLEQVELSRVMCKISRERSRSPLGFSDRERPISVGN